MTVLPQLKQHVLDAAAAHLPAPDHDQAAPGRHQNTRRPTLKAIGASVPVLLSVGIAIVIAAVALLTIRHGNSSHPAAHGRAPASSRQELVHALGVLRTPQTKSDLDPKFVPGFFRSVSTPEQYFRLNHRRAPKAFERRLARLGYPKLDTPLVRVVQLPAWHAKVALEPATFQPSPSSPKRLEGLDLDLWVGSAATIPPSEELGTGPRPASVSTVLAHGLALTDDGHGTHVIGVVVVPDGVARITLRPIRLIAPPVPVNPNRFGAVSATVHHNIAVFQLPIPTVASRRAYSGQFGVPAVAQTIWFDAAGNMLKRTTTNLDVMVTVLGKPSPGSRRPGHPNHLQSAFCRQNPHAC
jgi:hypothetical protein